MKREEKSVPADAVTTRLHATVDLRPTSLRDSDFLFRVYRETMKERSEAYIRWDDESQKASLTHQLREAEVSIITVAGQDIGWLAMLGGDDDSMFLGHFYIQSGYRNRGIGSEILSRIISRAAAGQKAVELAVLKNNPARGFYERSGFSVVHEDEMRFYMRRPHDL